MDHFGISHAMLSMVDVYRRTARRSGRTEALIKSLRDGDRVLCGDPGSLRDLNRRIAERGLKVEVLMVGLGDAHRISERRVSTGRTIFDHTFVEQHFERSIRDAAVGIQKLQDMLSSEAEREAIDMAKQNAIRFER